MQYLLIQIAFIVGSFSLISLFLYLYYKRKGSDKSQKFKQFTIYLLILTLGLGIVGNIIKNSIRKKLVLEYYNQGLSYSQLDETQRDNVNKAIFKLDKIPEDERDKYREAFRYYMIEYYQEEKLDDEEIDKKLDKFIK